MKHVQRFTDEERQRANATKLGISHAEYAAHKAAGEKWCSGCRSWQPCEAFAANRSNPDGHQSMCRPCKKGYDAAYQAKLRNGATPRQQRAHNRAAWNHTGARPSTSHAPPAAPQPQDTEQAAQAPTPHPLTRVETITAAWDAAQATRRQARDQRRAARRTA